MKRFLVMFEKDSFVRNSSTEMLSVILVFILTVIFVRWCGSKPKNFPPGPPCLPIVGSALFVPRKNFHFYLEDIREKYGSVVGFRFGPRYVIGVRGTKEVREVLSREEFQGRPLIQTLKPGIMFSEGESWVTQRRFTVRHLRDFGFGRKTVETVIQKEAEEFFQNVLSKTDTIQVSGLFSLSTVNVLWAMMGGKRYSHDDAEFLYLLDSVQKRFRSGDVTGGLTNGYPFLMKVLGRLEPYKTMMHQQTMLNDFLQKAIDQHKQTKTETPRDLIDVYLNELEKPDLHPSFNETTLKSVCFDLFSAGAESVGNTLSFCLLYCVLYPEWQEKMYREILSYNNNELLLNSAGRLAFVEAFLSEVQRCNTIAPIAVPHKATANTELNGYFIPKGSMLLVSLWSVLQDKSIWKDPENFWPERFLDESGKYRRDVGWFPAFGTGKRVCPGENLAKSIIFVYFIALVKEFKFSIPEGRPKPSTICMPGFTTAPQPFYVKITKRVKG